MDEPMDDASVLHDRVWYAIGSPSLASSQLPSLVASLNR
jgi:hypothetical protein